MMLFIVNVPVKPNSKKYFDFIQEGFFLSQWSFFFPVRTMQLLYGIMKSSFEYWFLIFMKFAIPRFVTEALNLGNHLTMCLTSPPFLCPVKINGI